MKSRMDKIKFLANDVMHWEKDKLVEFASYIYSVKLNDLSDRQLDLMCELNNDS